MNQNDIALIEKLKKASIDLKMHVYKDWYGSVNRRDVDRFLGVLSNVLDDVDKIINSTTDHFNRPINIEMSTEINLPFSQIEEFVYGDYDYPATLQFADGLLHYILPKEDVVKSDIDEFYKFSVSKAFDNVAVTADDLLSKVTDMPSITSTIGNELSKYKTITNWKNLYDRSIKKQLYESAKESLLSLFQHEELIISTNPMRSLLMAYGYIKTIDFIIFATNLYIVRSSLLKDFCSQFVEMQKSVTEAFDMTLSDIHEDPSGEVSNIFQITDELIIRDPSKFTELMERFYYFIQVTSGRVLSKKIPQPNRFDCRINRKDVFKNNRFYDDLKNNSLIELFCAGEDYEKQLSSLIMPSNKFAGIAKTKLLDSLLNVNHGISTQVSPRHEVLMTLKNKECDLTSLRDCRDCALDLYVFAIVIGSAIVFNLNLANTDSTDVGQFSYLNLGSSKDLNQIANLLTSFYGEMMLVIAQRAAFLERMINALLKKETKKELDLFDVISPKDMIKELIDNAEDAALCAVPSTTRFFGVKVESYNPDLYDEESYRFYTMKNYYLKEICKSEYFAEAFNVTDIINKILAAIERFFNRIRTMLSSNKFKAARTWVVDHKAQLLAAKFSEPIKKEDFITVQDYRSNLNLGAAVNLNQFKNFIDSTNMEEIVDIAKWKKDAYAALLSREYVDILAIPDKKRLQRTYKSKLLYNSMNTDGTPKGVIINNNTLLKQHMAVWVSTLESADKLQQQFNNVENILKSCANTIKAKAVTAVSKGMKVPDENNDKKEGSIENKAIKTNDANIGKDNNNVAAIVAAYEDIVATAISPLAVYATEAITNQYSYIQQVFAKSQ